jgi:hypothetical protein
MFKEKTSLSPTLPILKQVAVAKKTSKVSVNFKNVAKKFEEVLIIFSKIERKFCMSNILLQKN